MLYDLLSKNIMPWNWDIENYGRDPEMIGWFYNEDLENVKVLKMMGL